MNGRAGATYADFNWPVIKERFAFGHYEVMGISRPKVEERMRVLTLSQLSKLDGCAADVFTDHIGHASKLAFTIGARLFVQKVLFARRFCGQGGTSANGLDASKEFVCTVL